MISSLIDGAEREISRRLSIDHEAEADIDRGDAEFGALLTSPTPLEDIFSDNEQLDDGMFDLISGCIETRANDILEAMPALLKRTRPTRGSTIRFTT